MIYKSLAWGTRLRRSDRRQLGQLFQRSRERSRDLLRLSSPVMAQPTTAPGELLVEDEANLPEEPALAAPALSQVLD
jgi:hypothetical protein